MIYELIGEDIDVRNLPLLHFFAIFLRLPAIVICSVSCLVWRLPPDIDLLILYAPPISKLFPAHGGRCHLSRLHFMYLTRSCALN